MREGHRAKNTEAAAEIEPIALAVFLCQSTTPTTTTSFEHYSEQYHIQWPSASLLIVH